MRWLLVLGRPALKCHIVVCEPGDQLVDQPSDIRAAKVHHPPTRPQLTCGVLSGTGPDDGKTGVLKSFENQLAVVAGRPCRSHRR